MNVARPATPDTESFGAWLLGQVHRDDSIGDLARDAASGWCPCDTCADPDRDPAGWTVADALQDLDDHDAGPPAVAVVQRAAAEWRQQIAWATYDAVPPNHRTGVNR